VRPPDLSVSVGGRAEGARSREEGGAPPRQHRRNSSQGSGRDGGSRGFACLGLTLSLTLPLALTLTLTLTLALALILRAWPSQ